jgi:hypothetical protein
MSFGDWFRRIFKPATAGTAEPMGDAAPNALAGAPGVSPFADIETAQAVEDIEHSTEAPEDPAP